jgi:hypothetical protein
MDTFVDAPDAATRVEDDFGPLEHAPTKSETAAPVTTNPIAILRITCPIFQSPTDNPSATAAQLNGIHEGCIAID